MNSLKPASHWILKKYFTMVDSLDMNVAEYEFAHAVDSLYKFLWDSYADWYVEYLKTDKTQLNFAKELFKEFVITASPYIPFEAEVLWKEYFGETSILAHHLQSSEFNDTYKPAVDQASVDEFDNIVEVITSIRSTRGLFAIDPGTALVIHSESGLLTGYATFLEKTARTTLDPSTNSTLYTVVVGDINYALDINKFVSDPQQEIMRTNKIIESLIDQKNSLEKQLSNQQFLQNAGEDVIAQKRDDLEARTNEIRQQESKLEFLNK